MKTVSQVMEYLNEQGWKDEFFKYARKNILNNSTFHIRLQK